MKMLAVLISALVLNGACTQLSLADENHDKWIDVLSVGSGVALASDHGMDRDIIRRIQKPKAAQSATTTTTHIKKATSGMAINGGLDRDIIRRKY